jgi:hypothetical protein
MKGDDGSTDAVPATSKAGSEQTVVTAWQVPVGQTFVRDPMTAMVQPSIRNEHRPVDVGHLVHGLVCKVWHTTEVRAAAVSGIRKSLHG